MKPLNAQAQEFIKVFKDAQPVDLRPALDPIIAELAKPGSADHTELVKKFAIFGGKVSELELKMLDGILDQLAEQPAATSGEQKPASAPAVLDGPFGVEANSPVASNARRATDRAMKRAFNNVIVTPDMVQASILAVPYFATQPDFAERVASAHMAHHSRLGGQETLATAMAAISVEKAFNDGELSVETAEQRAASIARAVATMEAYPELRAFSASNEKLAGILLDMAVEGDDVVKLAVAFNAYDGGDPRQTQGAIAAIHNKIFPPGKRHYSNMRSPTFESPADVTPLSAARFLEANRGVPMLGETDTGEPAMVFRGIRSENRVAVLNEIILQAAEYCGFEDTDGLRIVVNGMTFPKARA